MDNDSEDSDEFDEPEEADESDEDVAGSHPTVKISGKVAICQKDMPWYGYPGYLGDEDDSDDIDEDVAGSHPTVKISGKVAICQKDMPWYGYPGYLGMAFSDDFDVVPILLDRVVVQVPLFKVEKYSVNSRCYPQIIASQLDIKIYELW